MRGPGLLWMLQTAAGFSMAGPMFFLGLESVRTGQYEWAAFYLTLGALVCYFPTYLVNRIGGPRAWIRRRLERRGRKTETDGGDDDRSDSNADDAAESSPLSRLERLRDR
ncbi:hypothetical protein HTZ84_18755 [Haloterrigena sp. SYSU A558-1]|uniref:Uncharacterized protein n=1 Tax=Haloterrigena gelatinilytica TaxID=2741724 RepID=A0A8J8KEB7_9EURY|nr:hypothetical protein [Haloterrigena gelatinilytica]NUB89862.1 hypothetical protein [Haloterrigena gelatinilytica]NUC74312.1 hypothetical protein [Haloterrigena gelatinilytica]